MVKIWWKIQKFRWFLYSRPSEEIFVYHCLPWNTSRQSKLCSIKTDFRQENSGWKIENSACWSDSWFGKVSQPRFYSANIVSFQNQTLSFSNKISTKSLKFHCHRKAINIKLRVFQPKISISISISVEFIFFELLLKFGINL